MKDPQRVLLYTYTGLAGLVCAACIAAIFLFSGVMNRSDDVQTTDSEISESIEEAVTAQTPAVPCYIVKAWNGGIGVFDESDKLIRTFSTSVASLSDADQQSLKKGIRVIGKQALDQLLEDLTS